VRERAFRAFLILYTGGLAWIRSAVSSAFSRVLSSSTSGYSLRYRVLRCCMAHLRKGRYSGALSLINLFPGVGNLACVLILAFGQWPIEQRLRRQGGGTFTPRRPRRLRPDAHVDAGASARTSAAPANYRASAFRPARRSTLDVAAREGRSPRDSRTVALTATSSSMRTPIPRTLRKVASSAESTGPVRR